MRSITLGGAPEYNAPNLPDVAMQERKQPEARAEYDEHLDGLHQGNEFQRASRGARIREGSGHSISGRWRPWQWMVRIIPHLPSRGSGAFTVQMTLVDMAWGAFASALGGATAYRFMIGRALGAARLSAPGKWPSH